MEREKIREEKNKLCSYGVKKIREEKVSFVVME